MDSLANPHRFSFTKMRVTMLPVAFFPSLMSAIDPPPHLTDAGIIQLTQASLGQVVARTSSVTLKEVEVGP